jgi:hypothetical protein
MIPVDPPTLILSLDAFGASYHTNRQVQWHQENPGLGVTVGAPVVDAFDVVASVGSYIDSYDLHARYALGGFRFIIGERYAWHIDLVGEIGYYDGSGIDGMQFVPVLMLGYNRVNLCATGMLAPNQTAGNDPKRSSTSLIAVFAEYDLWRF